VTPEPIRVIVADDHPLFRQGIGALLRDAPETELVAEAASGEEAVALGRQLEPDVVVMDVSMPGLGGVNATRELTRTHPHVAVLVVTMMDEDESVSAAIRAGARGYVLKGSEPAEILRAVLAVAQGQAIFGAGVAGRLERFFTGDASAPARVSFPELTPREREILTRMAGGEVNATIASRLGLSEKTVRNNVSNIFTKLRVTSRAAAVARARDAGVGAPAQAGGASSTRP
jgi:DNA-binding NarL/FixJ family response regulator